MYRMLLRRSGLSANGAAKLHEVTVGQVKEWLRYKVFVPPAVLNKLDAYCCRREVDALNPKR